MLSIKSICLHFKVGKQLQNDSYSDIHIQIFFFRKKSTEVAKKGNNGPDRVSYYSILELKMIQLFI